MRSLQENGALMREHSQNHGKEARNSVKQSSDAGPSWLLIPLPELLAEHAPKSCSGYPMSLNVGESSRRWQVGACGGPAVRGFQSTGYDRRGADARALPCGPCLARARSLHPEKRKLGLSAAFSLQRPRSAKDLLLFS